MSRGFCKQISYQKCFKGWKHERVRRQFFSPRRRITFRSIDGFYNSSNFMNRSFNPLRKPDAILMHSSSRSSCVGDSIELALVLTSMALTSSWKGFQLFILKISESTHNQLLGLHGWFDLQRKTSEERGSVSLSVQFSFASYWPSVSTR